MSAAEKVQKLVDEKQGELQELKDLGVEVKADIDAAYDQGVKDNQAANGQPDGTKIYSLDELNEELAKAVAPLNDQIAADAVKIADLEKEVADLKAVPAVDVDAAVALALDAERAKIGAQIRDANVDNDALADSLAPRA